MVKLLLFLLTCLYLSYVVPQNIWAASVSTVSVTSSSAGTQIVSSIGGGVTVIVPSSAVVSVWFARLDGTCSTTLTTQHGIFVTAGNGYEFLPKQDQWDGQICAILDSGNTPVLVEKNIW